jgi:hypothetical protein
MAGGAGFARCGSRIATVTQSEVKNEFQGTAVRYTRPNFWRATLAARCCVLSRWSNAIFASFMYTAVRKCGAWRANRAALWLEGILAGAWLAAHDEVFEAFSVLSKLLRPCHGLA